MSLIIPTYNCAGFLDETMGSVLDQLPDDCELVVVDDGSTDETPELLREYENKYDKLKLSLRSHGGVSAARNAGLDVAEGEWVAFMDCDDMLRNVFLRTSCLFRTMGRISTYSALNGSNCSAGKNLSILSW